MSAVDHAQEQIPDDVLDEVAAGLEYRDLRGWIPWAWAVLARAGDVRARIDEDLEEYSSHLVTLAGLGHLFELFHEIARYCEREGIVDREFPETADGLLREAIVA